MTIFSSLPSFPKIIALCVTFSLLHTVFLALPARAEVKTASPLSHIYACMDIKKAEERLACYDKNISQLKEQETQKNLLVVDAQKAEKLRQEAFGFSLPSLPSLFGMKKKDTPTLLINLKSWKKTPSGPVFTMDNGQVWRFLSGQKVRIPRGDLKATLKKGALSSYTMRLENEDGDYARAIRVKRIK